MSATDDDALAGFQLLAVTEGIVPALEPAHAIGWLAARPRAPRSRAGSTVLVTLSGRGDKDAAQVAEMLGGERVAVNLESHLRARRDAGRKLLVPYVTGGLGAGWLDVVRAVADAGADAIEIGIPFSDPVMDGPTIQAASQRALEIGATPTTILAEARNLDVDVPLAVMTYYNPVHHAGCERFAAALARRRDRRRDRARPPPRRARRVGRRGRRRRRRDGAARRAHHHRRAARARSARDRAASSTASR